MVKEILLTVFSVASYEHAAWAYIRGLENRVKKGQPIDKIASVASFFLSRIDTKIDDRIDEQLKRIGTETLNEEARLRQIQAKVAIALRQTENYSDHLKIMALHHHGMVNVLSELASSSNIK